MIDGVRECTGSILNSYVCQPDKQPAKCSAKAWKELTALTGSDAITPCAWEPDIMACSVPHPDDQNARCYPEKHPAACSTEKWERVKGNSLVYACNANKK